MNILFRFTLITLQLSEKIHITIQIEFINMDFRGGIVWESAQELNTLRD
jgi:hypothetical protein